MAKPSSKNIHTTIHLLETFFDELTEKNTAQEELLHRAKLLIEVEALKRATQRTGNNEYDYWLEDYEGFILKMKGK